MSADSISPDVRHLASPPADWPRWFLDHPNSATAAPRRPGGRFEVRAWVLPVVGAPYRLATCVAGVTRVHDPDMDRRDVIAKLLPLDPDADPWCGYALVLPIAPVVRIGLAHRGELHWLVELRMDDP